MESTYNRRVLALFNPKSGIWFNYTELFANLSAVWDCDGTNLYYQESKSPEDGKAKARAAIRDGVDTIIVIGGDGMVNTIGAELIASPVALAVIPTGSGNGFARHFSIPLRPAAAARALRSGIRRRIDVGYAGSRPFFITASLAWDAELVKGMQKTPIRGVLPYVFSGIHHFFHYTPQDFDVELDGAAMRIEKPLVLTIANLTQYGVGVKIAPEAVEDDGKLILVAIPQLPPLEIIPKMRRLFDGSLYTIPEITSRSFTEMAVSRQRPDPIQVDGELVEMDQQFTIKVAPAALEVLVPREGAYAED